MFKNLKKQSPVRIIALSFFLAILLGSGLLMLPISVKDGVSLKYIDALYTSTSAVCVTGLTSVDVGLTFTTFGQIVVAVLMQIGGLGVTTIGAGFMLAIGKKMDLKGINVIRQASNLDSGKGIIGFVKEIFITSVIIELCGAVLSFFVFVKDMPVLTAIGVSVFHSIASFNNAGFDILGGVEGFTAFSSLSYYKDNVLLNLTTCLLVILGGIGFLVIKEIRQRKFRWKKFSMHTKIVLSVSAVLITLGTLVLYLTEDISFLGAFFFSVSARTAGFSTFNVGQFSVSGLMTLMCLMFVGASPGSTGGGIKTTTLFTLIIGIKSVATNKAEKAFKYSFPKDAFKKASVITFLSILIVILATFMLTLFDPDLSFVSLFFETVSAFGTVGLSMGITTKLSIGGKLVSILVMYMGRLGPLTMATLWNFSSGDRYSYPEGNIAIG